MSDEIPKVPVNGKPHIVRYKHEWVVAVGPGGAPRSLASMASKHAQLLEKSWRDLNLVIDTRPPQEIEFSEIQDPNSWGDSSEKAQEEDRPLHR